jgi:hypothetical protein
MTRSLRAVADGRDRPLASQPTLSRLETAVPWESIRRFARLGLEWFCDSARRERKRKAAELVLDIDSTADPTHGSQQLTFFNGHYNIYMYHPLLIFEGGSGRAARFHPAGGQRGRHRPVAAGVASAGGRGCVGACPNAPLPCALMGSSPNPTCSTTPNTPAAPMPSACRATPSSKRAPSA